MNEDATTAIPIKKARSLHASLLLPPWRLRKGIINASDGELEASGDACEIWSWLCGGVVVLGVFAEAAIAWFHPAYDSPWERWGSAVANAWVVLGVAGEVQFSVMAFRRDKELKRRSDQQVAEANVRANEAALELAKLQRKIEPRVISDEGESAIIAALHPFPGLPFNIEADPAAEHAFVNRLITVLQRAGWVWRSYTVTPNSLPGGHGFDLDESMLSRVGITINGSKLDEWHDPAMALAVSLTQALQASVSMGADPPHSSHSVTPDAIHVKVGRKL